MWHLDPPEYFDPPGGGRYVTYSNDVRGMIAAVERERFGGAMPVLYKHMVAVSYQLAIFRWAGCPLGCPAGGEAGLLCKPGCPAVVGTPCKGPWAAGQSFPCFVPASAPPACSDALAAAVMLNRTVVLPRSWCWCDYDWTPHVLEKCKIRCAATAPPWPWAAMLPATPHSVRSQEQAWGLAVSTLGITLCKTALLRSSCLQTFA